MAVMRLSYFISLLHFVPSFLLSLFVAFKTSTKQTFQVFVYYSTGIIRVKFDKNNAYL